MSSLDLNAEPNITVTIRLIMKGESKPLTADHTVRLYDKDLFDNDFLGESVPNANGLVTFTFTHDSFNKNDWGMEDKPDFYFVVLKGDTTVFTSPVMEDVDAEAIGQLVLGKGEVLHLGDFLIGG
jgi:hypothetical protein